jgi:hypothetical protein
MFRAAIVFALLTATAGAYADGSISGWVKAMGYIEKLHPVEITVLDPLTGEAIPGLTTVNNEDGTYEINGIPEGDYKVLYDAIDDAERHIDELSGNVPCDNGDCDRTALGKVVHIGAGNTKLNITLVDGMWLSGKVTDSNRKPLPGVTIEFYDIDGNPHCCKRVSDENGAWSRPVFYPGTYYAVARFAEPSSYQPQIYPNQPCSGCDIKGTGEEIFVEFPGKPGINFLLPSTEANPDIERKAVRAHKFSGSWYDPERPGEGFIVEVLDQTGAPDENVTVVVFWFTYTPDGRQAWMVGTGPISGGVAEVAFEITDGAAFGADFDPQQVTRKNWGSLRLEFLNCNDAHAEYAGNFGSGQLALTRLTAIDGLGCADAGDSMVSGTAAVSGAWFNPARDGQGFILEAIDETSVLAYWFTYDTSGQQMWMLGVGDIEDGGSQAHIPMERSSGGRFGDAFDPDSVVLENWGEVSFQFGACDQASYHWEASPPFGSGGFELARLTTLKNIACPTVAEAGSQK